MSEKIKKEDLINLFKKNIRIKKSSNIDSDIFQKRKFKLISEIESLLVAQSHSRECSINATNLIKIIQSLPDEIFSDKIFFEKNSQPIIIFKKDYFLQFLKKIHTLLLKSLFLTDKQKISFGNIERYLMKLFLSQ